MSQFDSPPLERERPEPNERRGPLPTLFLVAIGGLAVFGGNYLISFSGENVDLAGDLRSPRDLTPPTLTGEQLFRGSCASCHQDTGRGVPGTFPPLVGSPWVLEDDKTIVRILLLGIDGPIEVKGSTYNGQMPKFGDKLTDRDIAAVATHVRGAWGNTGSPIDPKLVVDVRKSLGGRTSSWKGGVELQSGRTP